MHRNATSHARRVAVIAHAIAAIALFAFSITGCDTFSNLTVNCQVGVKNDNDPISGCNFQNTGKEEASGCVKVHVVGARTPDGEEGETKTFVSDTICSGKVAPGAVTEPMPLTFASTDPRVVADACVEKDDDGRAFNCTFKIEEVAQ